MTYANNKEDARETWRPPNMPEDRFEREALAPSPQSDEAFETMPPSRHDKPTKKRAFRIPPLKIPQI